MTEEEKKEFTELKHIRAERGFWTTEEQKRWDELFTLHSLDFKMKCKALDKVLDEKRMMRLN